MLANAETGCAEAVALGRRAVGSDAPELVPAAVQGGGLLIEIDPGPARSGRAADQFLDRIGKIEVGALRHARRGRRDALDGEVWLSGDGEPFTAPVVRFVVLADGIF